MPNFAKVRKLTLTFFYLWATGRPGETSPSAENTTQIFLGVLVVDDADAGMAAEEEEIFLTRPPRGGKAGDSNLGQGHWTAEEEVASANKATYANV